MSINTEPGGPSSVVATGLPFFETSYFSFLWAYYNYTSGWDLLSHICTHT